MGRLLAALGVMLFIGTLFALFVFRLPSNPFQTGAALSGALLIVTGLIMDGKSAPTASKARVGDQGGC